MLIYKCYQRRRILFIEYDKEWLKKTGLALTLDPELMPYAGRQYPNGKNIFGLFADASPDRWGRVLMNKCERILGGIRFKSAPEGSFLSESVLIWQCRPL